MFNSLDVLVRLRGVLTAFLSTILLVGALVGYAPDAQAATACSDGIDNDGDSLIDYPADPGCISLDGTTENPACFDGIDNDGDSLTDFPFDPGCGSPYDTLENPACNDGIDNDSDGWIDYPIDPSCTGPADNTEVAGCSDGIDNDGDGYTDYPSDTDCASPDDNTEAPACSDGIDNDGDGRVDFNFDPDLGDPDCGANFDDFEETLPVTLQPGDIAIIHYRTSGNSTSSYKDGFTFVILRDIASYTQIAFTDEGWDGISLRFDDNTITSDRKEHTWIWTAPRYVPNSVGPMIPAGTVVQCGGSQPDCTNISTSPINLGTLQGANGDTITNFSASGEQIIAYQGDRSRPTFLYALSTQPFITQAEVLAAAAAQSNSPITNNTSMLPPGLINGVTAHDFDAHIDNGALLTGSSNLTREFILNYVADDANWIRRDTLPWIVWSAWSFTIAPSVAPRISVESTAPERLKSSMIIVTVGDTTDALVTDGIDFLLQDGAVPINSAGVTSSNLGVVDPGLGNVEFQITGSSPNLKLNLKVNSIDSGMTDIKISISDGTNSHDYIFTLMALPQVSNGGTRHRGIADASAAIHLGNGLGQMLVAGDEHVGLHDGIYTYSRSQSDMWTENLDLSWDSGIYWVPLLTDPPSELDLEGGLRDGNSSWWISSSSNNKNGKCRPNRHGLYKVNLNFDASGNYQYSNLVAWRRDIRDQFVAWDNADIHQRGPSHYGFFNSENCWVDIDLPDPWINTGSDWIAKRIDGFNIEGLARAPLGSPADKALIGFRAPIVPHTLSGGVLRDRALVVPTMLTAGASAAGENLVFGTPIELDLGGRGVRSIARNDEGDYIIIAGSFGEHGRPTAAEWTAAGGSGPPPNDFRLYTWSGRDPDITRHPADMPVLQTTDLTTLRNGTGSFEGIVRVPTSPFEGSLVQLIVDDGVKIDLDIPTTGLDESQKMMVELLNRAAKLMAPFMQSFRSYIVTMDNHICYATANNGLKVYGSRDAQAIQNAVQDAISGGTIKIAGTCEGESFLVGTNGLRNFLQAAVNITDKSLTLYGGYSKDDWATSDPIARPTIIGPGSANFAINIDGTSQVSIQKIEIQGLGSQQFNVAGSSTVNMAAWNTADSGAGSLRQLITDLPAGSTITFDTELDGQTITLGGTQLAINKSLVIDASGLSAGITISGDVTGDGPTPDDSRIFEIKSVQTVEMIGLTLSGGNTTGNGGGIFSTNSSLTLTDMTLSGNTAIEGGAIYAGSGGSSITLTMNNCAVLNNTAANNGGGLRSFGIGNSVNINNSTLSGNTATSGGGGGIFDAFSTNGMTMTNSTLSGNSAVFGAGIYSQSSSLITFTNSTVSGNTTTSSAGGGVYTQDTPMTLTHTTIVGNSAASFGGGGLRVSGTGSGIEVALDNSIISGNSGSPGADIRYISGTLSATGVNLIGDNDTVTTVFPAGAPNVNGDLVGIPALLAPLGDYGGPTQTMPPQLGSPAIDAGAASSLITDQRGYPRPAGAGPDIGAVEEIITNVSPATGQIDISPFPILTWSGFLGATYEVFLNSGSGFQSLGQTTNTSLTITAPLPLDTEIQWRIDTIIGTDIFTGSIRSFTTVGPLMVTTIIDENDAGLGLGTGDSLREIIAAIPPSGAIINFDAGLSGQTITLGGTQLTIDKTLVIDASALPGGLTISGDVTGDGPTPDDSRIFEIYLGLTVEIKGLTLSGGHVTGTANGGAILCSRSSLTLTDTTLSGNSANEGGGIYFIDVSLQKSLTINNSAILNNTAASHGGGVRNILGTININNSTLSGNTSTSGGGGGIFDANSVAYVVNNSTLSGNSAVFGAGVYSQDSSLITFTNSTVSGNTSTTSAGGGIYTQNTPVTLTHTTIADNSAATSGGGGMVVSDTGGGIAVTFDNSIIAGNSGSPGADIWYFSGTLTATGTNLIGDNSTVTGYFTADNLLVGTAASPVNPALAPLGDYGGPTQTMLPLLGSPAIDAAAVSSLTTDQRGAPRPAGAGPDIGAVEMIITNVSPATGQIDVSPLPTLTWSGFLGATYEVFLNSGSGFQSLGQTTNTSLTITAPLSSDTEIQWRIDTTIGTDIFTGSIRSFTTVGSLMVTTIIDENDAGLGLGTGDSLREIIANVPPSGAIINFNAGLSGQVITLGGTQLTIDKNLVIDASGLPGGLTISGDVTGDGPTPDDSRIFEVSAGISATLKGLTITGGNTTGDGGGILNYGTLDLSDSTLLNNTAAYGGALRNHAGGTAILERCTLFDNNATQQGGAIFSYGNMTLTNTTISGNTAPVAGGGIAAWAATYTLINTTVINNGGASNGGGVFIGSGGILNIEDSIVAGNTSTYTGADIRNQFSIVIPVGANLIGDNNSVTVEFPTGPLHGTTASPLDPMLAPLGDYGGPTLTIHPLDGSPAIDAAAISSLTTDQRGVLRPFGTANDLGAVEVGDFDNDSLIDSFELSIGSSPLLADTDGDGLSDYAEVSFDGNAAYTPGADLNPLSNDTDGDGYSDGAEVLAGTDPLANTTYPSDGDLNNDGIVNVVDVLIGQQILSGQVAITPDLLTHGDVAPLVNGVPAPDGQFTVGDLVVIQRKALGVLTF